MTIRSAEEPTTTQSSAMERDRARPATAAPGGRRKTASLVHPPFTPWQPKPVPPLPALAVQPPAPPAAEVLERLRAVVGALKKEGVVLLDLTVRTLLWGVGRGACSVERAGKMRRVQGVGAEGV